MKIRGGRTFRRRMMKKQKKCREFGRMITNPKLSDPMIDCFEDHLWHYGIQPVTKGEVIELCTSQTLAWTLNETNILIALWAILGRPKIKLIVGVELFVDVVPNIYREFWDAIYIDMLKPYLIVDYQTIYFPPYPDYEGYMYLED